MAQLVVAPATALDVPAMAALEFDVFARAAPHVTLAGLADARYAHWVARVLSGADDVGPAMRLAGFLQAMWLPDRLDILSVATAASSRRQRCGTRLVQAAIAAARAAGLPAVTLEVAAQNLAARALYRGLGFTEDGLRRGYYPAPAGGAADDAVLMSLRG